MNNREETGKKFCELLDIIARLRGPEGCPWDRKQTVQSFKPYLIEETHELSEALDNDDPQQIREELGDLFFQLGFINQLYEEKDTFSIEEVLQSIIDKMIRRHPHVFEGKSFASYEEMRRNWARVKEEEKTAKKSSAGELDLPKSMPALSRAQKVAGRAARAGFAWPAPGMLAEALTAESGRLREKILAGDPLSLERGLGDLLFLLVQVAGAFDINSEESLHAATGRFIARFKTMEKLISGEGMAMDGMDSETHLAFWEKAKGREE
jgi:MazG family protein